MTSASETTARNANLYLTCHGATQIVLPQYFRERRLEYARLTTVMRRRRSPVVLMASGPRKSTARSMAHDVIVRGRTSRPLAEADLAQAHGEVVKGDRFLLDGEHWEVGC